MLDFTVQCGEDSQTFPIYINGQWVVNVTLSAVPHLYRYEILETMTSQALYYTSNIRWLPVILNIIPFDNFRTYLTHGQVGLSIDNDNSNIDFHLPDGFSALSNNAIVPAPHINGYVMFFTVWLYGILKAFVHISI